MKAKRPGEGGPGLFLGRRDAEEAEEEEKMVFNR
jgi:hypothetical protein